MADATEQSQAPPPLSEDSPDESDEVVVSVSKELLVELGRLAKKLGVKPSVALSYAVSLTNSLYDENKGGAKVFLEKDRKRYNVTLEDPTVFSKLVS